MTDAPAPVISDAVVEAALDAFHSTTSRTPNGPMRAAIRAAVLAEREECAKVAESGLLPFSLGGDLMLDPNTSEAIATAIRARSGGEG